MLHGRPHPHRSFLRIDCKPSYLAGFASKSATMGADEDRNTNSTLDRVMLGSTTVTFGPGLSVQLIVTGFESRLGSPQHFTHLNAAIEKIDSRESSIEVAH